MEETLDFKELQSYQGLLNYVFETYRNLWPFVKVMHLTLDSWYPNHDPEGWKYDPYGLYRDNSEDNFGGESEEALGEITGMPRRGLLKKKVNLRCT